MTSFFASFTFDVSFSRSCVSSYIRYHWGRVAASTSAKVDEVEPTDTITNALMNRCNHYVSPRPSAKTQDTKQYNALVNLVKERKFGVRGSSLADFEELLALFSSLLWEIDPHYDKICNHGGGRFSKDIDRLLGFNDPKKHKQASC